MSFTSMDHQDGPAIRLDGLQPVSKSQRLFFGSLTVASFIIKHFLILWPVLLILGCAAILSEVFKRSALFLIGSLGQATINGPKLAWSHFVGGSPLFTLDVIYFAVLRMVFPFDHFSWLVSLSLSISVTHATLNDQKKLTCSDEEFINAFESFTNGNTLLREKDGYTVSGKTLKEKEQLVEYSWEQIQKHNSEDDLWVGIDGLVYDITAFFPHHPGGRKVLTTMAGRDCTDVMEAYHPSNVFQVLPKYLIGKISSDTQSETSVAASESEVSEFDWRVKNEDIDEDHRKARQFLLSLNLFETDLDYYTLKFLMIGAVLALGIYLNIYGRNTGEHLLSAALIAVVWQQTAFIGHDLGHTGVSHKRGVDFPFGAGIGTLLGGISISWWKYSHNVHHINCNSVNDDPDIQHMPVMAVNESMLGSFFSRFHERFFVFDGAAKILLSYQHVLYYPIMAVARLNLYLQSIIFFLKKPQWINGKLNYEVEFKSTEVGALLCFFCWYGALVANLPTVPLQLAYFLLTHAVAGILHVQICISHFSMLSYEGQFKNQVENELLKTEGVEDTNVLSTKGSEENWLLLQTRTTMDVDCPTELDFFHGGLQFQIEHHLFPRFPRHNLRIAQILAKHLCNKHGLDYQNQTFFEANKSLVNHLYVHAMEARHRKIDARDFMDSEIYESINLIG